VKYMIQIYLNDSMAQIAKLPEEGGLSPPGAYTRTGATTLS
jgi:hypothetical protein